MMRGSVVIGEGERDEAREEMLNMAGDVVNMQHDIKMLKATIALEQDAHQLAESAL